MKIRADKIEFTEKDGVAWGDIKGLKVVNNTLEIELNSGKVLSYSPVHPATIDSAFRAYESYLREHPRKHKSL